jgi:hypothetical protein
VEPRIPQAFATRGLVVSNTVKIRAGAKVQDIYWFNDGETRFAYTHHLKKVELQSA